MNEEISSLGFGLVHISLLTAAWGLDWCISHCSQRPGVWIGPYLTAHSGLGFGLVHISLLTAAWGLDWSAHSSLGFGSVHISLLTAAWGLDRSISHCSQRPGVWLMRGPNRFSL
jgi:hypothetical protein